jgi:hypothetical protein
MISFELWNCDDLQGSEESLYQSLCEDSSHESKIKKWNHLFIYNLKINEINLPRPTQWHRTHRHVTGLHKAWLRATLEREIKMISFVNIKPKREYQQSWKWVYFHFDPRESPSFWDPPTKSHHPGLGILFSWCQRDVLRPLYEELKLLHDLKKKKTTSLVPKELRWSFPTL